MNGSAIGHVDKLLSDRKPNNAFSLHISIAALMMFEHMVRYALSGTGFLSTPPTITHGLITTGRLPDDYQSDIQVVLVVVVRFVRLFSRSITYQAIRSTTAIWPI